MSIEFSTGISAYNANYNLNAVDDYNKYLKNNASFEIDKTTTAFDEVLEDVEKKYYLRDKNDAEGLGNFATKMANAFVDGLNSINNAKLEANRMQEDLAMGGPTNIHDAMIAAEKASLSMQMAIQVRNRIVSAYTDITSMSI